MDRHDYRRTAYRAAVARLADLPPDTGVEVAFAGRSNAGKSSALNALTGRRGLARTSKTPGRTQLIQFFDLADERRLVDLPGYGYARAPERARRQWGELVEAYLQQRRSLAGLMLITDIRRELTDFDRQLLSWCEAAGVPAHLLLTKADKLGRGKARAARDRVRGAVGARPDLFTAQVFSAQTGEGVDEARRVMDDWLA